MRKFLLSLVAVIALSSGSDDLFAQSRTDRANLTFNSKTEKLTDFTGWCVNPTTGKWIDNKNIIYHEKESSQWRKSHTDQNAIWLQFASISYEDVEYYILLVEKYSGRYRYPEIYEEWIEFKKTEYLIFTRAEYDLMKNNILNQTSKWERLTNEKNGGRNDQYSTLGGANAYTEQNLLADVTNKFGSTYSSKCVFLYNSQNTDGVDVVRFRVPESGYSASEQKAAKAYFEIPLSEFNKLLVY